MSARHWWRGPARGQRQSWGCKQSPARLCLLDWQQLSTFSSVPHIKPAKIGKKRKWPLKGNELPFSFENVKYLLQVTRTSPPTVSWRTWRGRACCPPPPPPRPPPWRGRRPSPPSWSASAWLGPAPAWRMTRLTSDCRALSTRCSRSRTAASLPPRGQRRPSSSCHCRTRPGRACRRVSSGDWRAHWGCQASRQQLLQHYVIH